MEENGAKLIVMDEPKIKLVILEDQKILLDSFASSLKDDFDLVATFDDADGLVPFLGVHAVDVILADTCLKKTNTLDYLSDIKKNFPSVKVVIMTGFPEVSFLKKAKKEGADSFIYKNTSLEETKQVIVSTFRGYSIFPSENISDENRFLLNLSPKEMEVLRYVCQGYDRKEIAEVMFNSENTIKSYIRSILNKTGYDSISKLAIYAVSHGFVLPSGGVNP
jgi:DNA-binding NarL/FixJ family response regulator